MLLYWDTNIFLTYYFIQKNDIRLYQGIADMVTTFESGSHEVITSVITRVEVLPSQTPSREAYNDIQHFFGRIVLLPVDRRIGDLAAKLRDSSHAAKGKHNLEVPDAIHIATAVVAGADYLCTNDTKMLNLGSEWIRNQIGGEMQIIKPPLP